MSTLVPLLRRISIGAAWQKVLPTAAAGVLLFGASVGAQEIVRVNDLGQYSAAGSGPAVELSATKRLWTAFIADFDARAHRSEVLMDRLFTASSDAIGVVEKTVRKSGNILFGRDRGTGEENPAQPANRPADPIPPAIAPAIAPVPQPSPESLDELVARVQKLNSERILPAPVFDRERDRMLVNYENGADPYPEMVAAVEQAPGARHLLDRLVSDQIKFGVPNGRLVLASSPVELQIAALDGGLRGSLTDGTRGGGIEDEIGSCVDSITTWDEASLATAIGDSPIASLPSARPRRLPDGSVFMPKPSQRLLSIRTTLSCEDEVVLTTKAFGHVIRDPNASGLVQAGQTGRVKPGVNGLPYVGMLVRAGQELGVLVPAISNPRRGDIEEELAELRNQIVLRELKLVRTRDFFWIPFRLGRLLSIRLELDGLRNRRDALIAALDEDEHLLASADGVISMAKITAGQLVEAHDVLWEIVDPDKLWVEVLVYDGEIASKVDRAWALTSEGANLPVEFIGRGLTLENQGILLQFKLNAPPSSLSVGKPVTMFIESDTTAHGVILPQSAVVRDTSAQDIVWEHVAAERFVSHPVRVRSINGEQVVVLSGLGPDKRIVSNGAGLLNHVR